MLGMRKKYKYWPFFDQLGKPSGVRVSSDHSSVLKSKSLMLSPSPVWAATYRPSGDQRRRRTSKSALSDAYDKTAEARALHEGFYNLESQALHSYIPVRANEPHTRRLGGDPCVPGAAVRKRS